MNHLLNSLFKSVLEQDRAAVVLCDLNHTIVYMNPAGVKNYQNYGGAALMGKCLMNCHNPHSREAIEKVVKWFASDKSHNLVFTHHNPKQNKDVYMVALRDESGELIGYYEKHEFRNAETMPLYEMN